MASSARGHTVRAAGTCTVSRIDVSTSVELTAAGHRLGRQHEAVLQHRGREELCRRGRHTNGRRSRQRAGGALETDAPRGLNTEEQIAVCGRLDDVDDVALELRRDVNASERARPIRNCLRNRSRVRVFRRDRARVLRLEYPSRKRNSTASCALRIGIRPLTPSPILEAQDTSASRLKSSTRDDAKAIADWSRALGRVHVTPELQGYIVDIVEASRHHRDLLLGVQSAWCARSPARRRALAASVGVVCRPDDIKLHRDLRCWSTARAVSSEAMTRAVSSTDVLTSIVETVQVPALARC